MDLSLDGEQSRLLLAILLQGAGTELLEWGKYQSELCACDFPVDEPTWGNVDLTGISGRVVMTSQQPVRGDQAQSAERVQRGQSDSTLSLSKTREETASSSQRQSGGSKSMASFMALRGVRREAGPMSTQERASCLRVLKARTEACRNCELGGKRRGVLWGLGPSDASIMFVAAGGNPAELDAGRILTGEAAVLLDKIVTAMSNLSPEASADRIYMTNVIKCACLPGRQNTEEVYRRCISYLREEVRLVCPKVIVVWGQLAYRAMFGGDELISQVRGKPMMFEGIWTVATHHPMEMLRNINLKKRVWEDLQLAVSQLKIR